jgi:hypothetical protein
VFTVIRPRQAHAALWEAEHIPKSLE